MNWQLPIVILIVAGAAGYLGLQTWRSWTGRKAGCGKGSCGCGAAKEKASAGSEVLIPSGQLTLRRRELDRS